MRLDFTRQGEGQGRVSVFDGPRSARYWNVRGKYWIQPLSLRSGGTIFWAWVSHLTSIFFSSSSSRTDRKFLQTQVKYLTSVFLDFTTILPEVQKTTTTTTTTKTLLLSLGFPGSSDHKASACNAGDLGSIPESGRSPGEGNLPGKSHGWSLVGYSPWGRKESDTTERLHFTSLLSLVGDIIMPILQQRKHSLKWSKSPSKDT